MFNELAKEININVRKKGFWDSMHNAISNKEVNGEVIEPKNKKAIKDAFISQKIGLIKWNKLTDDERVKIMQYIPRYIKSQHFMMRDGFQQ